MSFLMKKMPKSVRIFIRNEKARIRHQFFDAKKQNEMIAEIYAKLAKKPEPVAEKMKEVKTETKKEKTKVKKPKTIKFKN